MQLLWYTLSYYFHFICHFSFLNITPYVTTKSYALAFAIDFCPLLFFINFSSIPWICGLPPNWPINIFQSQLASARMPCFSLSLWFLVDNLELALCFPFLNIDDQTWSNMDQSVVLEESLNPCHPKCCGTKTIDSQFRLVWSCWRKIYIERLRAANSRSECICLERKSSGGKWGTYKAWLKYSWST